MVRPLVGLPRPCVSVVTTASLRDL